MYVYRFLNGETPIYIGSTDCLISRLKNHILEQRIYYLESTSCDYIKFERREQIEFFEKIFINFYNPKYNYNSTNLLKGTEIEIDIKGFKFENVESLKRKLDLELENSRLISALMKFELNENVVEKIKEGKWKGKKEY